MFRTICSSLAIIALATAAASASAYRHPDNAFSLKLREGWVAQAQSDPMIKVVVTSPRESETGGNCSVGSTDVAATKNLTQEQIDAALDSTINESFWSDEMKSISLIKSFTIEKSGQRKQNGRNVYYARITSVAAPGGQEVKITELQDMHAIPGELYLVTCTAVADKFDREESDFTAIMASFDLKGAPVASLERAPSSLTLYADAKFAGISRVVTQDTPDLSRYGWGRTVSSLSIGGASAWEVCDGADYTGHCRTIAGSTPALSDGAFVAGSAHRLNGSPARVFSRVAATAAHNATAAAVNSLRRR